jgi:hypothetical protein
MSRSVLTAREGAVAKLALLSVSTMGKGGASRLTLYFFSAGPDVFRAAGDDVDAIMSAEGMRARALYSVSSRGI